MENQNFVIKRKNGPYKKSLIILLITGIIIVITFMSNLNSDRSGRVIILQLLTLAGILVISFLINSIAQILKKSPALEFTAEGLTDNTTFAKVGLIAWNNISSTEIKKFNGSMHLFIFMKDQTNFISNLPGSKKKRAENIMRRTGSPVAINLAIVAIEGEELARLINGRVAGCDDGSC